jgi:signal peptidase
MTAGNDRWVEGHWYLQPWMTDFRPRRGAAPAAAPHPPGVRRSARPSIGPLPFEDLRGRLIPHSPLLGGGVSVANPPTEAALRRERALVTGLMAAALLVYVAINAGYPAELLRSIGVSSTHPLLWPLSAAFYWSALTLAGLAVWRSGMAGTPSSTSPLLTAAGLAALFQISLVVVAGLFLGLGRSPYAHGFTQVIVNALYVLAILAAIEVCRASVVVTVARTHPTLAVAAGAVVFALVRIPVGKLSSVDGGEAAFAFFGGELLPALAIGLVASVLALAGGPLPAILYGATLQAFEWLSPVLPNLAWAETAFVWTLGPVIVLAILQPPVEPVAASEPTPGHRWAFATGLTAVVCIWFVSGFFGVQPVAVSGPSMVPTFGVGDLVVVQDVEAEEVVVGDVIRFYKGATAVIHRVVEIQEENGRLVFVTRGDGNNVADDPITAAQVDARVVMTIPKLGWPAVALRSLLS